jgi:hypothetical protein
MFLRNLAFCLLFINLGYAAYTQGWLSQLVGWDARQREPERLARQINETAIEVQLIDRPAPSDPSNSRALQSPTENGTKDQPPCANSDSKSEQWLVYMGPFSSQDLLVKKETELSKLKIEGDEVSKSSLPRGLSLGKFASESEARVALSKLQSKGVKTATVLLWSRALPSGC